jgi:hypothetical protein
MFVRLPGAAEGRKWGSNDSFDIMITARMARLNFVDPQHWLLNCFASGLPALDGPDPQQTTKIF